MSCLLGPLVALSLIALASSVGALLRRAAVDPEWTRKATHFLTACACLPLPWLLSSVWQVVGLAVVATLLVKGLRRAGWLGFLDDVERSHLSEYAYIAGLAAVFVLGHAVPRVSVAATLVLGVCDALAAIVGQRFGRHRYTVFGKTRSWEGSAAFALSAWVILVGTGLAFGAPVTLGALTAAAAVSTALAAVEAVSVAGLDNLSIPVVAVVLLQVPQVTFSGGLVSSAAALLLPLVVAGLVHQAVRAGRLLPALAVPLDDALLGGRMIFGQNKTLRGVLVVPVSCGLAFWLEQVALAGGSGAVAQALASLPPWAGLVTGLGSTLGELPNSFLKRRLGVAPGHQARRFRPLFFALDHLDSALGAGLALGWLGVPLPVVALGMLIAPGLHVLVNLASFGLHVRETAW